MIEISEEAQRLIAEAKDRAMLALNTFTLPELIDFNSYVHDIEKAYEAQERLWRVRDSLDDVPLPRYMKIVITEIEKKTWWPKCQKLFSEDEGKEMDGLTFVAVREYLHNKARENPIV